MTTITAFDHDLIHAGNKALDFDYVAIDKKVEALLSTMTLAQKINEIRGKQAKPIDGLYYAGGDEQLNIPEYKMVDGPRGARTGKATAFPVALARAATFDVELERRVGLAIGAEVLAKGGNVLLAPTINLLRHPGWGRAQETYSEDMFHMGAMAVAFISGAQNHVLTSPKHFAINNIENTRFEMSANVSARVLHEIYLPHFKRCIVEAGASSIMSAYNKVNDIYCGENTILLNDILRDDWGFKGFVESDWFLGTRSTSDALNAGMDIEMPSGYRFSDEKLMQAIEAGELSEATITRAAGRSLTMKVAWDLANQQQPSADVADKTVESAEHLALAREVAEKAIVLLKNENNILPLANTQSTRIAIVGDLAKIANLGDRGSSFVTPTTVITPFEAIEHLSESTVTFFASDDDLSGLDQFDTTVVVAGLTYIEEGEFIPTQQQEAEGEGLARGGDRSQLALPEKMSQLILKAQQYSKRTVVILEGGSAIEVGAWIDTIDALLMAWYPGCQGGAAIADILFGEANPSGHLPVSMARKMSDLVDWDITSLQVDHPYLHGYRYLDHHQTEPQYAFGFGLSYTRFDLQGLLVERYENGFRTSIDVTNIGAVRGATVVQLYIAYPGSAQLRAPIELKGFGRVELDPGENATLVIDVTDDELAYFDEENGWTVEACQYEFQIGLSSRDIRLSNLWQYDSSQWTIQ